MAVTRTNIPVTQTEDQTLDALKARFENEKQNVINTQIATHTITLRFKICCGCGCTDFKVKREVPLDYYLKDGDTIHYNEVLDTDIDVD